MLSVFAALLGLNLFSSVTIQSTICQMPLVPAITSPASDIVSKAQTVMLDGTGSNDSTVTIYDNNQVIGTITPDFTNSFEFQASLASGSNTFSVKAENLCGSKIGNAVTVTQSTERAPDTTPSVPQEVITPVITLVQSVTTKVSHFISTASGTASTSQLPIVLAGLKKVQTTSAAVAYISGTTGQPANVRLVVNNMPDASLDQIASSTAFGFSVPLREGINNIVIIAVSATATSEKDITITRTVSHWYQVPTVQIIVTLSALLILIVVGRLILL